MTEVCSKHLAQSQFALQWQLLRQVERPVQVRVVQPVQAQVVQLAQVLVPAQVEQRALVPAQVERRALVLAQVQPVQAQ